MSTAVGVVVAEDDEEVGSSVCEVLSVGQWLVENAGGDEVDKNVGGGLLLLLLLPLMTALSRWSSTP